MRDKVIDSARRLGLDVDVRRLDASTATARQAAEAIGCREGQIVKSLVFVADGDPVVCLAPGSRRVDLDLLADAFDAAEVRQAGPDEVCAATGFAVGGVAPVGHDLPVVMEETLLEEEEVWAAAGDGHSVFSVAPQRLLEATGARAAPVTEG